MLQKVLLNSLLILSLVSCSASTPGAVYDPFEPVNRKVFWFNDKADTYVLKPIAQGYTYVVPSYARSRVTNFFNNLGYPVNAVGDLLQLKFSQFGVHTARFAINSTIGVAGLFEVAEDWGLEPHQEDVGIALAYWGVPDGPYLVLPFFGPSNLRDTIGSFGDRAVSWGTIPYYFDNFDSGDRDKIFISLSVLDLINSRANLLDALDAIKEGSVDYYSTVRSSYAQRRNALINDLDQQELSFDDEEFEDFED